MQADAVSAPVDNHNCVTTAGPTSDPIVDKPDGSATANVDLAAIVSTVIASTALAAVNQLRSNTSPDQFSDIMAALTRNREGDDSSKCSENRRKRRGSASRASDDASQRTTKRAVRTLREEALQHLSMIATTINFNGFRSHTCLFSSPPLFLLFLFSLFF